jgi:hypothetical protein
MKFEEPSPKESFDDPRHREREVAARGDEVPFSDVAFGATKEPELRGAKCSVVVKIWASEARRREAREILADHSRHGGLPAEPGTAGARSGTRPARTQGLQPARSRGRVHRQGQTAQALRVRRQGERRHHLEALQGRPVRHPRAGAARQSPRRTHPRPRHPRDRGAHWAIPSSGSTPTPATAATTPRGRCDAAPPSSRYRPSQERALHGPQLSRRPQRRRQQRHSRRRIQLPPPDQVRNRCR